LKRDPMRRNSPAQLVPEARTAIVCSVSYYTERPKSPGAFFGDVALYAVGLDYHAVLRAKLRELKAHIENEIGRSLLGKVFTDDVQLHEGALAARHGLGFSGRNTLIIGPKLSGSYNFIAELFTDLEIEPDEAYCGTCGKCFRCGVSCPTGAITSEGQLNSNLCISYLTIENKDGIPIELRPKVGNWVFGCDICQEVCPYNQKPAQTPWHELCPEAGVGHFLDLPDLLTIRSENEFIAHFEHSPLRRPKRRGLLRNALVVIGNHLRSREYATVYGAPLSTGKVYDPQDVVERIFYFAEAEPDSMLREHAAWAISQFPSRESRNHLEWLIGQEPDCGMRAALRRHRLALDTVA